MLAEPKGLMSSDGGRAYGVEVLEADGPDSTVSWIYGLGQKTSESLFPCL